MNKEINLHIDLRFLAFCNNDSKKMRVLTTGQTSYCLYFSPPGSHSQSATYLLPARYTSLETFLFPLSCSCTTASVSCTALSPFPIVSHKRVFVTSSSQLPTISCEQSSWFIAIFLGRPWIGGDKVNDMWILNAWFSIAKIFYNWLLDNKNNKEVD